MSRMIRNNDNMIRPRKNTGWATDSLKPQKGPVFKINESDFGVNLPTANLSYNYYSNNTPTFYKKGNALPEKEPELKRSFLSQLEKYCENTTLHGLRYVGDTHLSFGERIFWFISFSLAIGFAAYYISNIYTKWKTSPVIISFSPFDADLSSIPFPAITICNMNQAKKSEAERILKDGSDIEKKLLDDSCNGNATFKGSENISWEALKEFLVRVGNSCSDILKWCKWGSDRINCEDFFNNDLTDEGLCCSFNRLPPEKIFRNWKDISILNHTYPGSVYDWDAEKGFTEPDTGDIIPRRPLGAGAHLGLSVVLDAQVDNYYCSSTRSTGFKVILSNPIETPKMADFGFFISPGFETRISIEPSIREATASLRSVPIEKRQCYFSNERPLQYYRKYSFRNCQTECQSANTLLRCGCVPYYLPMNTSSDKLCRLNSECTSRTKDLLDKNGQAEETVKRRSYTQKNCLHECYSNFTLKQCYCIPYHLPKNTSTIYCSKSDDDCVEKVSQDVDDLKNGSFLDGECDCKPACFEIKFSHGHTSSPLFVDGISMDNATFNKTSNLILATFYFDQPNYQKQIKDFLYGFSEILSNFGGILSLCLGVSFLSIVEMLYYVSLRLFCSYARNHRREKKIRDLQLQPPITLRNGIKNSNSIGHTHLGPLAPSDPSFLVKRVKVGDY